MIRRETSPVHTVFVDSLESGIGKPSVDFAKASETFFFLLVVSPGFLSIRHNAN